MTDLFNIRFIFLELIFFDGLVILMLMIYTLLNLIMQRQKILYIISVICIFGIEYYLWQLIMVLQETFISSEWDAEFERKVIELGLLQALVTIVAVATFVSVQKRKTRMLSRASIKVGVDNIPAGIMFYWPNGIVKLVNKRMDEISQQLVGEGVLNGIKFWKQLGMLRITGEKEELQEEYGADLLVKLPDGNTYGFRRKICKIEGHELYEILAINVTEEQKLNEQLKNEQEKADKINERLKKLNSTIELLTSEKEILETKSMVHDEWGKTLVMTRRYLMVPDDELAKEILRLWKLNSMLMRDEEDADISDDYTRVLKDIRNMGLEMRMKGSIPQDDASRHVLVQALRTCATNALRHGKATMMNVITDTFSEFYLIKITNNGKVPEQPISMGGGLESLKKVIEDLGGSINPEFGNEFGFAIRIPKKKNNDQT